MTTLTDSSFRLSVFTHRGSDLSPLLRRPWRAQLRLVPSDLRSMSRAGQGEGGTGEAPGRDETHPPGLASTGRERLLHYAPQGPLPAPRNPDSGPPSYLSVHKAVLRPMRARFVPMAHARVTGRC